MKSSFTVFITLFVALVSALHLEIPSSQYSETMCIRDFVQENQLVVVNIKTSGRVGDGQQLNLHVIDSLGNTFRRTNDFAGNLRIAFTSHHSAAFDVCFTNVRSQNGGQSAQGVPLSREVELDIESGAAARDWNAIQASDKLKPVEVELIRIEELTQEIYNELQYLKLREERMRDTNESTNDRVKYFSFLVIVALLALGVWQIQYLRHYFKVKHII